MVLLDNYIRQLLMHFVRFDYSYSLLEEAAIKFASVRFSLMSILVSRFASEQQFVHASWFFCGSICSINFRERHFQPLTTMQWTAVRADWFVCPKAVEEATYDRLKHDAKYELEIGETSPLDFRAAARSGTLLTAWFPVNNRNVFDGYEEYIPYSYSHFCYTTVSSY
jgi:hypothetical protein